MEAEGMNYLTSMLLWYGRTVHPPLVLALCISGCVGHLFTITTLKMMLNPTNALLISMSCSHLLLCVNFLYATLFKWASDDLCLPFFFSEWMAQTMHVSVTLSVLLHMSGVFHVVALSIVRYYSLKKLSAANSNVPWFTYQKCRNIILFIYASIVILAMPMFLTSNVEKNPSKSDCVSTYPELAGTESYELTFTQIEWLRTANYWLFNLSDKLIPSVVLCVMTRLILLKLQQIRVMSARFASSERDKQHHRTTMMILTIMFMFIVVELPQGILGILGFFFDAMYRIQYAMGDINELITLLTSCVIFAMFCSTSGKVRSALLDTPCIRFVRRADFRHVSKMQRGTPFEKQLVEVTTPDLDKSNNYAEV